MIEKNQEPRGTSHMTYQLLLLSAIPLLLGSCQLLGLRKQVETMENFGVVTIRVSPPPTDAAVTYGVAWISDNGQLRSAGFQRIRPDGFAAFILRTDLTYTVGAFVDENNNHSYDTGEPADYVGGVRPLSLVDPKVKTTIFELSPRRRHGLPPRTTIAVPQADEALGGQLNLALGEIVSLGRQAFRD